MNLEDLEEWMESVVCSDCCGKSDERVSKHENSSGVLSW